MQPWRFIRMTDSALRRDIHALVDEERRYTADALGPRGEQFLALKVEGILDCAELFVVAGSRRCWRCPTVPNPVAVIRLGPVPEFPDRPALELDRWTYARPFADFITENCWD